MGIKIVEYFVLCYISTNNSTYLKWFALFANYIEHDCWAKHKIFIQEYSLGSLLMHQFCNGGQIQVQHQNYIYLSIFRISFSLDLYKQYGRDNCYCLLLPQQQYKFCVNIALLMFLDVKNSMWSYNKLCLPLCVPPCTIKSSLRNCGTCVIFKKYFADFIFIRNIMVKKLELPCKIEL